MTYHVTMYCPDRHIAYDGRTPDEVGVGGGVTARVRVARALARQGHHVTQVVNCPRRETIDGVDYRPLDDPGRLEADVAVFNTSGGALDLSPALKLDLAARLRIVWVHGTQSPEGLDRIRYDALYPVSNFLARIVVSEWGVPATKLFVTYNGYESSHFAAAAVDAPERDPFQLIYFSHPSKGLETAIAVLRELRASEPRYHLEVVGGDQLWGGAVAGKVRAEGVHDHGLIGQRALAPLLLQSTYAMQMQGRAEPFGLSVVEAMRAGVVVVASPVGALPELITDGVNGVLVHGDHLSSESRQQAAERILHLQAHSGSRLHLTALARAGALDTDTLARAWTQHWGPPTLRGDPIARGCRQCGGAVRVFPDGARCLRCGTYVPRVREV